MSKKTTFHASKSLQLIYYGVCGPFKVNSTGGARYFITFIDDFVRKLWVYLISNKNQVLDKFWQFVHVMENYARHTVWTLRSNNGGEYTSQVFHNFCSSKEITKEFNPPHTPQGNGVAKHCNRSLLDITQCLLLDKALLGHLWGEVVKAAIIILNLWSTKKILTKLWTNSFQVKKYPLLSTYKFLVLQFLFTFQNHLEPNSNLVSSFREMCPTQLWLRCRSLSILSTIQQEGIHL